VGVSLVAEWDVTDYLTLKSITADRHLRWKGARDADGTPLPIVHTNYTSRSDQFSQELQALLDTKRIQGVVGAYYFDEDSFDGLIVPLGTPGPTSFDRQRVSMDTLSWAVFTEFTFNFTDALAATGGVRYTHETKGLQGTMYNYALTVFPVPPPEPTAPTGLCPFGGPPPTQTSCLFITTNRFERSFSSVIGSASVQYRFNEALMSYFSWSQGFKSGGFNQRYNNAPPGNAPIAFNDETAETYEVGFKANPMPGLTINGALFRTKYDDIQLTFRLGVVPLLFNAGVAVIKGGELEVAFSPIDDLVFDGSLGYLETRFDSITPPPPFGGVALTATSSLDSELPFTPEWQAHFGAQYSLHLTDGLQLTPRVDVSYTGHQFFDAGNSVDIAQNDAVTVVNGALSLESPDNKWRITVTGYNLTDAFYPLAGTSSLTTASGYAEIIYARPRTVAVTGSVRF
jgi:iron complex outermembrane receptor protein